MIGRAKTEYGRHDLHDGDVSRETILSEFIHKKTLVLDEIEHGVLGSNICLIAEDKTLHR